MKLNEGFLARMRDVVAVLQAEGPMAATHAIQETLNGNSRADATKAPARPDLKRQWDADDVTDVTLNEDIATIPDVHDTPNAAPAEPPDRQGDGQFITASLSNRAGTRRYKVYVPSGYSADKALPLVVMLHGCKQNPDDFAAGTRMNELAEECGCVVVYPAQAKRANGSNCWNWFQPGDQKRDRGEPSLIADITREVLQRYKLDKNRCYIAGLSAGGAMAAIMGASYPDLYAAVGIHSGLPRGAANNVPSAFAAMKNPSANGAAGTSRTPAIIFHGDRDATVHPLNGQHVADQHAPLAAGNPGFGTPDSTVRHGSKPQVRRYTVTMRHDATGKTVTEHWVVHGAGHAWSGGSLKGSYTDPSGPDASREMLRFFYEHTLSDRRPVGATND